MFRRHVALLAAPILLAGGAARAQPSPAPGGIVGGQRLQPRPDVVREREQEVGLARTPEREERDQRALEEVRARRERAEREEAEGRVPPNPVAPPAR